MIKDLDKKMRAYALKNALAYNGKANSGSVISALFNEGLKKEEVKDVIGKVNSLVKEVNSLSLEEQQKEYVKLHEIISERHGREGLPELPGAKKGKVVLRFAPSPSGPFHIGHAATACISYLFVKEYGGKFYVRIEDTNPENIYPQAYKMIEDESKWLFDGIAKVIIQSDRMKIYYDLAVKLISKRSAYVCTCTQDAFKNHVDGKSECPCRDLGVDENMKRWKKMLSKRSSQVRSTSSKLGQSEGYKEGEAVVRFKSSMTHKNPAMRDFPLARINLTEHPRQKKKYRVWPLMNLAVAADDIKQGMTHIIRAKDHRDNAERQKMIYESLGLGKKFPWTAFLGRIHFKDLELSTTQFRKGIEEKKYSGWDDKKLPTIASLKKQGYKPQAFWKFAERVGLSENDKTFDKAEYFRLLNDFNR
ncbi:MAG TPA: glutamate--tRNA ligase family protein [Candidatus Nanoarchaeia archaeon]|nr:glutamate--tRNA ligase family protein [Candidatus Nanoarchaeia archaeon]